MSIRDIRLASFAAVHNEPDHVPEVYELSTEFLRALSPYCRHSLRAIGVTQEGVPVIAGNDVACSESRRLWKVKHGRRILAGNLGASGVSMHDRTTPIRDHAVFEPLESGHAPSI